MGALYFKKLHHFSHYLQILRNNSLSLYWLLWLYCFWIIFGLFVLYTTTFFSATVSYTNGLFFIKKQLCWTCLSLLYVLLFFRIHKKHLGLFGLLGTICNLLAINYTLLKNFSINGARRWIELGPVLYQPVEIQKPFFLITLGQLLDKNQKLSPKLFIFSLLLMSGTLFGIFLQPDFASGLLYLITLFSLLFIQKLPYQRLIQFILVFAVFILINIIQHPYQLNRILLFGQNLLYGSSTFVNSQLTQSLDTILRGGIWGTGLGCGETTLNTLPIYYADFIFSVFLENFGIIGSCIFFIFLSIFTGFYFLNCLKLRKVLDILICLGCFLFLSFQTCIHLAVTSNLLPITGIPLPFISYGGNAQLACISIFSLSIRMFYENSRPSLILPTKSNT